MTRLDNILRNAQRVYDVLPADRRDDVIAVSWYEAPGAQLMGRPLAAARFTLIEGDTYPVRWEDVIEGVSFTGCLTAADAAEFGVVVLS